MSPESTPLSERDELLRAAALGELDRSLPEVSEKLRRDPELARVVEELERTRAATARALGEGAQLLARARGAAPEQDRALVHRSLRDLSRGGASERARRRRGWILALAGLAALLIGIFLVRASMEGPEPDHWLKEGSISIQHVPVESGPGALRWKTGVRPGEHLELSFYADRDGMPGELLLGHVRVEGDGWQPTEEQARVLEGSWFAELDRVDAGDERTLLGRVHCSSSP